MAVRYAAQLCGPGRKQASPGVPDLTADTHQAMVGDDAFVVDQQPFATGIETVKPDARVQVRGKVIPAAVLLVGGRKAVGVQQDQRTRRVEEGILKARRRPKARPLANSRR